jgi:hypothetical protein
MRILHVVPRRETDSNWETLLNAKEEPRRGPGRRRGSMAAPHVSRSALGENQLRAAR